MYSLFFGGEISLSFGNRSLLSISEICERTSYISSNTVHRTNSLENLNIWCLFLYAELLRFPYFCLLFTKFKSSLSADVVMQQKNFISWRSSVFWTGTKWPQNWKHISITCCCLLPGEESCLFVIFVSNKLHVSSLRCQTNWIIWFSQNISKSFDLTSILPNLWGEKPGFWQMCWVLALLSLCSVHWL